MAARILILDDEQSILEILAPHLENEGYECQTTLSPIDALAAIEKESFDLLLTDLRMPEIDGLEVVRRAKRLNPDLSVIVVTAMVDVTNAIDAMRSGADDYVLKPFNLSELSLFVSRALERRQLIIENRRHQEELEQRVAEATQDLKHANEELTATKQYLENLFNSTVDAILTVNAASSKIEFVNEGALRMTGHMREELEGHPLPSLLRGGTDEWHYIRRLLQQGTPLGSYETEFVSRGGDHIPINMSLSQVFGANGEVTAYMAICKDITPQKRLERELKEMSIKDSLTGLYNQRHFHDRIQAEVERARRQGHALSLLLIDIDQFKVYNDCHGHLEGDNVINAVGQVVFECTREHVDLGFRYGGDEFTVILPEAPEEQALAIGERIRVGFEQRRFDGLTLSIGLMTYRENYSVRSFIQFADAMMYDAKRSGGNRVYVYKPPEELTDDE